MSDEQEAPISPKVRLLPDLPADHDAFGPHGRVARVIADLIREEEGGKAIALTGSWGSGKSTVVRLIKGIFAAKDGAADPNELVFVFDAWSHEKDPLRRSFLEQLIDFLSDENRKWVGRKAWSEEKEKLAKRKRTSSTTQTPRLTRGGVAFAVSALLVPIGLVLLSTVENAPSWLPCLGGFLAAAPFLAFGLLYYFRRWAGAKCEAKRGNILALFVSDRETEVHSETSETPDPTSIEFQSLFRRLLKEALDNRANRRLVVVVDNLDRVIQRQNALSMWSTMRTFFEVDSRKCPVWMSQFWLIVPYDPSALQRLWRDEAETAQDKSQPADEVGKKGLQTREQKGLAAAFTDKTFQVTFEVPPPVLPKWKTFFQEQFQQAFPDEVFRLKGDLVYWLYHWSRLGLILREEQKARLAPPTPRDIKQFLNQVGAIYRQWPDPDKLPVYALFVIIRDRIANQPECLAKHGFLADRVVSRLGLEESRLHEQLAGLHFGVPAKQAMEIVLRPRILQAFTSGDPKLLADVADAPAFLDVCIIILDEYGSDWCASEPGTLALAAIALQGLSDSADRPLDGVWSRLVRYASRVEKWLGLNQRVGEGIAVLLDRAGSDRADLAQSVIPALKKLAPSKEGKEPADVVNLAQNWTQGALEIVGALYGYNLTDLVKEKFRVPGDAVFYVEVLASIAEHPGAAKEPFIVSCFRPETKPDEIVAALKSDCESGNFSSRRAKAVQGMLQISEGWNWDPLVSALDARLRAGQEITAEEIGACTEALLSLYYTTGEVSEAQGVLQTLAQSGHLAHDLEMARRQENTKAQAFCVFALLEFLADGGLKGQAGQSVPGIDYYRQVLNKPQKHPELLDAVRKLCIQYSRLEHLLGTKLSSEAKTFVAALVRSIIREEKEKSDKYLPPPLVIDKYPLLAEILAEDDSLQKHVKRLVHEANLLRGIQETQFDSGLVGLYDLAYDAAEDSDRASYAEWLVTGLRSVQKDVWAEELRDEGELLGLLLRLVADGVSVDLSTSLYDALLEHAKVLVEGEAPESLGKSVAKCANLLKALKHSSRKEFLDEVMRMLLIYAEQGKVVTPILVHYGDALLHSDVIDRRATEIVRRFFIPALKTLVMEHLSWMAEALERKRKIWTNCIESCQYTFKDRLKDTLEDNTLSDEVKSVLRKIARAIEILPEAISGDATESAGGDTPTEEPEGQDNDE